MSNFFYIDVDGSQKGPLSLDDLVKIRCLSVETMVWTNYMADWQRADSVEELKEYFTAIYLLRMEESTPPEFNSSTTYTYGNQMKTCRIPEKPETWFIWNILVTFFCCMVGGIIGIIFSNKADSLWSSGQYEESMKAARNAKICFFVSLGTIIFPILYLIFVLFATTGGLIGMFDILHNI